MNANHTTQNQTPEQQQFMERRLIRLPLQEKIQLFDQLATELESGTPVAAAFQSRVKDFNFLKNSTTDRRAFLLGGKPQGEIFSREMSKLLSDFGLPFHEAAEQFPGVFDPQFLATIKAAQNTGMYGPALRRQVQFFTEQKILRDHVKNVLRYPVIVLVVAAVVIGLALIYIVPGFTQLYEGLLGKADFNWTTQFVIDLSQFVTANWPMLAAGGIGIAGGYVWARNMYPELRRQEHRLLLRVPKINRYIVMIDVMNFLNSFILLREAGETLTKSFVLSVESMTNSELREAAQTAALNFEMGTPQYMHLALAKAHPVFSEASSVFPQLKTYEEYAGLDQLERYVKMLKHNADQIRNELAEYVQPVSMLIIGGIVGFLVFSLYIPLFELIGKLAAK